MRRTGLCGLVVIAVAACADTGPGAGPSVERETRGDTVIVRTMAGSVWAGSAQLIEELRIGTLDGADETFFGSIDEVAPDGEGGVYVFDGRAPALRHYDASGRYRATLGGEGSGPGEYRDASLGLFVAEGGRVLMDDPRNARINVYGPDGSVVDHWPVASGLFTANTMQVDTAGEIYIKILLGRPARNRPWPIGLMHLGADGRLLDTIPEPRIAGEPERAAGVFAESKVWEVNPFGELVIGVNSAYAFEVRRKDGTVLRIEKSHTPVDVRAEERSEWEARNEWTRRTQGQFMTSEIPAVPAVKPAYRAFDIGLDGRIWVHVYAAAEKVEVEAAPGLPPGIPPPPPLTWREPVLYDVFEPDGTYLGRLAMPDRVRLVAHRGTEVWGVLRGELDELYLVRYRLTARAA